jgi:hypothetical protein
MLRGIHINQPFYYSSSIHINQLIILMSHWLIIYSATKINVDPSGRKNKGVGRSCWHVGTERSDFTGGMDVCLLWALYVVRAPCYRPIIPPEESYRVWYTSLSVISKPQLRLSSHGGNNNIFYFSVISLFCFPWQFYFCDIYNTLFKEPSLSKPNTKSLGHHCNICN